MTQKSGERKRGQVSFRFSYDLAIAIDIAHISIGVATGNPWHVIGGGLLFGVELGLCHLMDAVLYGLLVEENLVGGIDVDRFGIGQ